VPFRTDPFTKNWSPDLIGAAVISFEWIAQGFTAVSFWTAPWRLITGLEDRFRFWLMAGTGNGPIESQ
jgi:hypothetical protein